MKRTLLFITCVLASLTMLAQEYYPEGTKWTEIRLDTLKYDSWYSKVGDEWVPNFETIEYYVKGEYTTKYGERFKCIYTSGPEWTDSLTLGIKEGELIQYNENDEIMVTVFVRDYYGSYIPCGEAMVYQFDWSVGQGLYSRDIFSSTTTSIRQHYYYYGIIGEIKEGYFGGVRPLKYVDLDGKAPADKPGYPIFYEDTQGGRIIQGIGITEWDDGECLFGPSRPYEAATGDFYDRHYRSRLVHFERNGEVLYDVWPDSLQTDQEGHTNDSDYIPFVEKGKLWHVVSSVPDDTPNHHLVTYHMNEKEVHDGKTYFRVYYFYTGVYNGIYGDVHCYILVREENRRVYMYDETLKKEIMMYDFTLKEGDTFTYEFNNKKCKVLKQGWLEDGPQIVSSCTRTPADTLDIKYRRLRTWTIGRETGSGQYHEFLTWVEGVGTLDNMFCPDCNGTIPCLAYIERKDGRTGYGENEYLPFSFYNMYGLVHGSNLPTGEAKYSNDRHHHLTYELEGDRLHVYGEVLTRGGLNNYAYFFEKPTDDPSERKLNFEIKAIEPTPDPLPDSDGLSLHTTDFYVPGFDPNLNYIIVDNQGEEHPVINKTPQMAYRPFVEDGKVWKVGALNSSNSAQWVEYYYFDGDTIIDGKNCKQMMRQSYVNPDYAETYSISQDNAVSYVGAWYEEDRKVFEYDSSDRQFKLMYDFSANANDTLLIDSQPYVIGPNQTGGIKGFKGVYRAVYPCSGVDTSRSDFWFACWLEGVGSINGPLTNIIDGQLADPAWFLMSCTVGDEVIYLNDGIEDGATPEISNAPKSRFDFTHIIKNKPQAPKTRGANQPLYGEYNEYQLSINLDPIDDAYLVRITNESGKLIYEKAINAGNIVALNIDISAYPKGRYTVTVENSRESFTGEFDALATGIVEVKSKKFELRDGIYNLQGQRIGSLQKGLNIVNGKKVYVK